MAGERREDDEDALRALLATWLRGGEGATMEAVSRFGVDAILSVTVREGVVSLIEERLRADPATPLILLRPLTAHALACRARNLVWLAEVRKIQQALSATGIRGLWLKGVALGQWLYPSPLLRDTADFDLLLPDHDSVQRVAGLLAPLGYCVHNPHAAGDLVVHELQVWSERARLELDLHWDLSNGALFANRLSWELLEAEAIPVAGLGDDARGLGPVHAMLHACMHRIANALHGESNRLRWLYDIHLLAERLDADAWTQLVTLAARLELADTVHAGLLASHDCLATRLADGALTNLSLHARGERVRSERLGNWTYWQWATLTTLPWRQRPRWLRQLLFPDMAHLRMRYGHDGAGVVRVIWRRAQDGYARWRGYCASRHNQ